MQRTRLAYSFAAFVLSLLVGTFTTSFVAAQESHDLPVATSTNRALHKIKRDARTALRAEATLKNPESWELAVRALVTLHEELRLHPKSSEMFEYAKLRRQVRSRLLKAKDRIETRRADDHSTLGQVALPQAPAAARRGAAPAAAGAVAPTAQAATGDYGDDLVALIERTVNADIWTAAGGSASIVYYQPALALVISAPADVHEDVADLLRQLRAAR